MKQILILLMLLTNNCIKKINGLSVKYKDNNTNRALITAIMDCNKNEIVRLLELGADINFKDENGLTSLMYVCKYWHDEKMKYEDLVVCSESSMPDLPDLIEKKSHFILELLLKKGANVNDKDNEGKPVLMLAIDNSVDEYGIKLLLEKGADITFKDNYGRTILIRAIAEKITRLGFYKLPNIIFDKKIINMKDNYGCTALMCASYKGNLYTVKKLIEKGANIDVKDLAEKTALMYAKEGLQEISSYWPNEFNYVEVINLLGNYKKLIIASKKGNKDVIDNSLRLGFNVDAKNKKGKTLLIEACEQGNIEIVKLLIQNKADVNAQDDCGNTSLVCASRKGHIEILKLLLEKGAYVSCKNNYGMNALMYASHRKHNDIFMLLLEEKIF